MNNYSVKDIIFKFIYFREDITDILKENLKNKNMSEEEVLTLKECSKQIKALADALVKKLMKARA